MKNMNYAIIENELVVNVAVADAEFAQSQGWVACPDYVSAGWGYVNGQWIAPAPFDYSEQNKTTATLLLSATDWTCTVDINNPQYSNPYLMNQGAFLNYRSQVRAIAVNPPTTLVVFPTAPTEVWSN